jgi:membrane-bound inhibitor of C-type lysozyme
LSSMDGKLLQVLSDVRAVSLNQYADGVYLLRITDSSGALIKNEKILKQQ